MWSRVRVTTPPAAEALTLAQIKDRLRIDPSNTDHDALLPEFQRQAVAEIDGPQGVGVALMAQTWTLTLDRFPPEIRLPGWPVTGVAAIRYIDGAGVMQTLLAADYRLVVGIDPVSVTPTGSWPATDGRRGSVEVDYTLGAATPDAADPGLITALSLLIGHYFEHREAVVIGAAPAQLPLGVAHTLDRYRRGMVA